MLFGSLTLLFLKPLLLGLGLVEEAVLKEPLVWPKTAISWGNDAGHLIRFLVERCRKFAETILMLMVFKCLWLGPQCRGKACSQILYLYFVKPGAGDLIELIEVRVEAEA